MQAVKSGIHKDHSKHLSGIAAPSQFGRVEQSSGKLRVKGHVVVKSRCGHANFGTTALVANFKQTKEKNAK